MAILTSLLRLSAHLDRDDFDSRLSDAVRESALRPATGGVESDLGLPQPADPVDHPVIGWPVLTPHGYGVIFRVIDRNLVEISLRAKGREWSRWMYPTREVELL